ncbi:restriction endonuclease subunit S [Flavihumibacter stibioxidans]|uniref:Type I restriction modification DNA specificity domain-containing protein n=1 Tax=Flavihumibacter stibioxidans TaxID=1834163 RepID=A0ABR7MDJ9_9BACT|nr:restriction endonuclease subunit S [Flavihumibacter stibioxidans]MBC6493027.1 hypothetical protein [Flavihumibacter stibioxidans]
MISDLSKKWKTVLLTEAVDILDNLRKPINSRERQKRINGKAKSDLYPYYGATGQVGLIDGYLTEGEYVLIGEDGAPFLDRSKPKAYKIVGRTWVNNHAHILKGKIGVSLNDFILYYLNSIDYKFYVNGTTRLKLTKGSLSAIPIPLPVLSIQKVIVSKIEELFSELDKSIEQLKTAQQQLKTYRQAVLKWAFEGRLTNEHVKEGELPEGWRIVNLNKIGHWTGGGTPSKRMQEYWLNGNILWVTPKDMKYKKILDSGDKITKGSIGQSSAKMIKEGSILFVVRSGILRRVLPIAIAGNDLTTNQDLQSLTLNEGFSSEYVYWYCVSKESVIRDSFSKDGTTVDSIDVPKLKSFEIKVPMEPEQHQIVAEIESRLSVADNLEATIKTSLQQAESLRQSILKQAFEGKLI